MISEKITVGEGTEYPLNGLLTPFKDLAEGGNFRGIIMLAGTTCRLEDILKASKEYGTERHIGEDVTGDIYEFISAL